MIISLTFENKSVTSNDLFMDASIVSQSCFYNTSHSTLYCSNATGRGFSINKINLSFFNLNDLLIEIFGMQTSFDI